MAHEYWVANLSSSVWLASTSASSSDGISCSVNSPSVARVPSYSLISLSTPRTHRQMQDTHRWPMLSAAGNCIHPLFCNSTALVYAYAVCLAGSGRTSALCNKGLRQACLQDRTHEPSNKLCLPMLHAAGLIPVGVGMIR